MHKLRKTDLDIDNETWHVRIYFAIITGEEWATDAITTGHNKAFIPKTVLHNMLPICRLITLLHQDCI